MVSKPNTTKIFGEPGNAVIAEVAKFIEPLNFDAMPIYSYALRSEHVSYQLPKIETVDIEKYEKVDWLKHSFENDKLLNSDSEFKKSFLNYINQLSPEHEQYNYWFNKIRNINNLPKIELKVDSVYELIFKGRIIPKEMELVRIENFRENKIPDLYFRDFGALRSTKISFLKIYKKV